MIVKILISIRSQAIEWASHTENKGGEAVFPLRQTFLSYFSAHGYDNLVRPLVKLRNSHAATLVAEALDVGIDAVDCDT